MNNVNSGELFTDKVKIKRALISVTDKNNIEKLAKVLVDYNIEILSTGGTAKFLKENAIPVKDVSDETNFPEILNGRVKTLHPKIHGGILSRRNNSVHIDQLQKYFLKWLLEVSLVKEYRNSHNFHYCQLNKFEWLNEYKKLQEQRQ